MPIAAPADEPPHDRDPLIGTVIGDTVLVRRIGVDALGIMYEGHQQRLDCTVAVRIMRPMPPGTGGPGGFDPETNSPIRFSHPGVVRVYATGVHDLDGTRLPYCIMELVRHPRTLTDYAEELRLPIRARVDLFRSVCDAVAHIHDHGVMHRDLRPATILVDAFGNLKITGLPLAHATDPRDAITAMDSDVHMLVGAPRSMSPEQMRGEFAGNDLRSDVYALGVVLHELLTGRLPYDFHHKPVSDVIRTVLSEDPPPMSAFDTSLHRDLVAIVGKCLRRDQDQRYASVGDLRDDLVRHLAGEPTLAAPPTFLGRLRNAAAKLFTRSTDS